MSKKTNCWVLISSLGIIVLNSMIVRINDILNTNLKLSMFINIALIMREYS
jgi:hypothetical protein